MASSTAIGDKSVSSSTAIADKIQKTMGTSTAIGDKSVSSSTAIGCNSVSSSTAIADKTQKTIGSSSTAIATKSLKGILSSPTAIGIKRPILKPPSTAIGVKRPILKPPSTAIGVKRSILKPPSTAIGVKRSILKPPSTAIGVKRQKTSVSPPPPATATAIEDKSTKTMVSSSTPIFGDKPQNTTTAISSTTTALEKRRRFIAFLDNRYLSPSFQNAEFEEELQKSLKFYLDIKSTRILQRHLYNHELILDFGWKVRAAKFRAYCKKDRLLEVQIVINSQKCKNADDPAVVREKKLRAEYEKALLAMAKCVCQEKKFVAELREEVIRFDAFLTMMEGGEHEE